jgi:hypothetical protein
LKRQSFRYREIRHVLTHDVGHAQDISDSDNHHLPQAPVERGLPAHRVVVLKPAFREGWTVQQQFVNVDQAAAPRAANSLHQI